MRQASPSKRPCVAKWSVYVTASNLTSIFLLTLIQAAFHSWPVLLVLDSILLSIPLAVMLFWFIQVIIPEVPFAASSWLDSKVNLDDFQNLRISELSSFFFFFFDSNKRMPGQNPIFISKSRFK